MSEKSVSSSEQKTNAKLSINLDFRLICIVLLLVIAAMLAIWRPWGSGSTNSARTITVTGESTLNAAPDEYVFSPQYEFKDADKATALANLTAKQDEIVTALKKLGVAPSKIKADSSGYNYSYYYDDVARSNNYTLSLTITAGDKTLAQKVQDYLVGTGPTGSVSPRADFSNTQRKQLESQGRDAATREARAKADQSAKNLGFKVGSVKSVNDNNGAGVATPMYSTLSTGANLDTKQSLAVQPGENDLDYSVTVVYYLK